jgi:molybdopterin-guanine dinucleotide biosynthesis protein A
MPFLVPDLIEMLFCVSHEHNGTLLVKPNGWFEPLPSVYKVSTCVEYAEKLRQSGEMRIRKVLETMPDTAILPIEKLRNIDPELRSFIDLDTMDKIEDAKNTIQK